MSLHRWICEDASCNHELYASQRPEPSRWRDGHVCTFIPVPHIDHEPEYTFDGVFVEGGLKELIHANYICGGAFDFYRLKALIMLRPQEELCLQFDKFKQIIRRVK